MESNRIIYRGFLNTTRFQSALSSNVLISRGVLPSRFRVIPELCFVLLERRKDRCVGGLAMNNKTGIFRTTLSYFRIEEIFNHSSGLLYLIKLTL